jgi:ABC-type multidrug transport system ATPase subunit
VAAGAGKSSLLNVLGGKAQAYGVVTGTVLINGHPDRLERYRDSLGFVPQAGFGFMCGWST